MTRSQPTPRRRTRRQGTLDIARVSGRPGLGEPGELPRAHLVGDFEDLDGLLVGARRRRTGSRRRRRARRVSTASCCRYAASAIASSSEPFSMLSRTPSRSISSSRTRRPLLELVGERLDVVRPAERVDGTRRAALVRDDLLRSQGEQRGLLGREREGLVPAHGVHGLGAREDDRQRLHRCPDDVVQRLDARQRRPVTSREEPQRPRARVARTEAVAQDPGPDPS